MRARWGLLLVVVVLGLGAALACTLEAGGIPPRENDAALDALTDGSVGDEESDAAQDGGSDDADLDGSKDAYPDALGDVTTE